MKRILLILLLSFFPFITNVFSQEKTIEKRTTKDSLTGNTTVTESVIISTTEDITQRNNMITINPLKFFLFYNINYYGKISSSVAFGGGIQTPTLSGIDGFGINAELRFYPSKRTLRGFYISPNLSFNRLGSGGEYANSFSMGVLLGWQWFLGDDFAIGIGIGIDRYFISDTHGPFDSYEGNIPAVRFDIGYGW